MANSEHIPSRSLQQRMGALDRANDIRVFRADLKRKIKAGQVNVVDILNEPHEKVETMKIIDLLLAIPKLGRTKVNKLLGKSRVSPSKTVGGLTERQRDELIHYLTRR